MGLFDFIRRLKGEEKVTYGGIPFWTSKPISDEEYQRIRNKEVEWLESHYDLTSAEGIRSIPERCDLPRPTFGDGGGFRSYTGDIDYYLRRKGFEYEEAGNIELAILCLQKSNAIRMVSRRGYRRDDYYSYVRLLARSGFVEEAYAEKEKIDSFFGDCDVDALISSEYGMSGYAVHDKVKISADDDIIKFEAQRGINKRDYKWIQDNLPEICPKSYSGYMRMKKSNSKNYQKIVAEAKKLGRIIE